MGCVRPRRRRRWWNQASSRHIPSRRERQGSAQHARPHEGVSPVSFRGERVKTQKCAGKCRQNLRHDHIVAERRPPSVRVHLRCTAPGALCPPTAGLSPAKLRRPWRAAVALIDPRATLEDSGRAVTVHAVAVRLGAVYIGRAGVGTSARLLLDLTDGSILRRATIGVAHTRPLEVIEHVASRRI